MEWEEFSSVRDTMQGLCQIDARPVQIDGILELLA